MATSLLNFHFETIPRLCKGDIFDYHPTELQGKVIIHSAMFAYLAEAATPDSTEYS